MSKLIERLEKVGMFTPVPIGFGVNRAANKAPSLVLVALSGTKPTISSAQLKADSYIVVGSKVGKPELKAAKDMWGDYPWGLWPDTLTKDSLDALKGGGGDFFIFSSLDTNVEVLAEENLGKLITIPVGFPEELGHSLEEIPVDAVLLTGLEENLPMSVKDLMQIRSIRDLTSKPILLVRAQTLNRNEMVVLQDVGIQGIVVDMRIMKLEDAIQVRDAIDGLPPRKTKHDQSNGLLPRLSLPGASPQQDDDEDDDDDEDYD
jgi:hypothetical protein